MLSVLITAFREAATLGRAIEAFLPQLPAGAEILVVCPDPETTAVVNRYAAHYPAARHVTDPQQGKPTALSEPSDSRMRVYDYLSISCFYFGLRLGYGWVVGLVVQAS